MHSFFKNKKKETPPPKKTARLFAFFLEQKAWILLFGIFALALIGNMIWWQKSTLPPHWDMTYHLNTSLGYHDLLYRGNIAKFLFQNYAYYPPLVYQLTAFFYSILSLQIWVPYLVTTFFSLLACLTTYALGARIFRKKTGLIAAFLLLLTPIYYVFSRDFLLDIPLLALVMTTILLLSAEPFEQPGKSFLLGLALAAGLLIKWSFGIFVFFPLLYFGMASLAFSKDRNHTLLGILITCLTALILAGPWYFFNFSELVQDASFNAGQAAINEQDPVVNSVRSIFYYPQTLLNEYFYLPLSCLIIFGVATLAKAKEYVFLSLLGGTVIWSTLVFTLVANKDPRYIMPLLPLLLLAAAYGLSSIQSKVKFFLAGTALAGYLIIQFTAGIFDLGFFSTRLAIPSLNRYLVSYEQRKPPNFFQTKQLYESPVIHEWVMYNPFSYFGQLPHEQNWHLEDIAQKLSDRDSVLVAVDNEVYFNAELLLYYATVAGKQITLTDDISAASFLVCQTEYCDQSIVSQLPAAADSPASGLYGRTCSDFELPGGKIVKACRLDLPNV